MGIDPITNGIFAATLDSIDSSIRKAKLLHNLTREDMILKAIDQLIAASMIVSQARQKENNGHNEYRTEHPDRGQG